MLEDPVIQFPKANRRYRHNRLAIIALQFIILFALWLALCGSFKPNYLLIGALAAGLVTFLTEDIFYSLFRRTGEKGASVRSVLRQLWYFLIYLIWLFTRIVKANIQVAYLVLHPKMPIDPVLLQFHTRMHRSLSQVTLANSITLTPGTITVNLKDGSYIIHVLVPSAADDIIEARMQKRIGAAFGDTQETPPTPGWVYSVKELEK